MSFIHSQDSPRATESSVFFPIYNYPRDRDSQIRDLARPPGLLNPRVINSAIRPTCPASVTINYRTTGTMAVREVYGLIQ